MEGNGDCLSGEGGGGLLKRDNDSSSVLASSLAMFHKDGFWFYFTARSY